MARVEEFHMKWRMRNGEVWNPDLPFWSAGWRDGGLNYKRVPRRVDFEVVYFEDGEYVHPLTGEEIDRVFRLTRKVRVASWKKWRPMQRLEVDRYVYIRPDADFRWSPVRKKSGLEILEELNYAPRGIDRWFWDPIQWTFFFAEAMIVFEKELLSDSLNLIHKPFMHLQFDEERNITNFPLFWISAYSQVVEFK